MTEILSKCILLLSKISVISGRGKFKVCTYHDSRDLYNIVTFLDYKNLNQDKRVFHKISIMSTYTVPEIGHWVLLWQFITFLIHIILSWHVGCGLLGVSKTGMSYQI